jgi:hypothetical protein
MFSIVSFAVLVLDLVAVVSLLKSPADTATKVLWILVILFLPLVGMLLYFLVGPGRRRAV